MNRIIALSLASSVSICFLVSPIRAGQQDCSSNGSPVCGACNCFQPTVYYDNYKIFQLCISDPDGDPLTFSLITGPGICHPSGWWEWTPTYQDVGTYLMTFRGTDPCGAYVDCTCYLYVLARPISLECSDVAGSIGAVVQQLIVPQTGIPPFEFLIEEGLGQVDAYGAWMHTLTCDDSASQTTRVLVRDSVGGLGTCEFVITKSPGPDNDGDGFEDACDNCPGHANANQDNADEDLFGDICDPDDDNDGVPDSLDNSPREYNPGQEDSDGDGIGDASDPDDDNDGIGDDGDGSGIGGDLRCHGGQVLGCDDNCPGTSNPNQADMDDNGVGDACEGDFDGDGVPNEGDNCPNVYNPTQADNDDDLSGDPCDSDDDDDGCEDFTDNCPLVPNPGQEDGDEDGAGDVCDPCTCLCHGDPQCDSVIADVLDVVNTISVAFRGAPASTDPSPTCAYEATDTDCSGATDVVDVVLTVNVAFRGADVATEYCDPCP